MQRVPSLLRQRLAGALLVTSAAIAAGGSARAQTVGGDDTRLRLDQGIDRRSDAVELQLLEGVEDLGTGPTTISIDGRTYTVARNASEMGEALYIAVARRQWADARRFLKAYLALPERDRMLVFYAEGALARQARDLASAERYYRALLALQPDFLPGLLELARVLFENRKDGAAFAEFRQAQAMLESQGDKAAGIRHTVDTFVKVLRRRSAWQGSLAIGPGYSSNLNQSSASYACLLKGDDGTCLIDRKVPDAIQAAGINFEGTLSRRVPIGGNGGIAGRALLYGDIYPGNSSYSQATLSTQIGYDHQSARGSFALAPSFDIGSLGSATLYTAWGVRGEALVNANDHTALRIELSRKILDYRLPAYRNFDGAQTEVYLTGWHGVSRGLSLFGGPDFVDKTASNAANAYRQLGFRFGMNKSFGKAVGLLVFTSLRWRDYRAYSELLEAKRHDREQNIVAIVKLPVLRFAGLTPNILVQHNRVESNVDWLYSYKRTTAALRLEYAF
ncbi:surface lipoprotein assembly modifier [Sphingomonas pituitosa]|uniref:surface lipoprotein assembly modifier n=1 Tax=Sphingomonas pituitosa TaxID=99597 RepID=UPI001FE228EA|nr:surface lipoprotein assembly modifier [Sphingomonas pituitosa]